MSNTNTNVEDKTGEPIKEGDDVDEIVTSQEQAEEKGVKNPPKVSMFCGLDLPFRCLVGLVLSDMRRDDGFPVICLVFAVETD
ncbi:MAG: hypothetical protein Q9166_005200 [cf. Caloplaca sp. 2 TL-2023]